VKAFIVIIIISNSIIINLKAQRLL